MMEKETSTRRSLLRALYLLPLVCISLALNAQTKVNYVFKNPSDQDSKVTNARITYDQDTLKYSGALIYENPEPGKEVMKMEAYNYRTEHLYMMLSNHFPVSRSMRTATLPLTASP